MITEKQLSIEVSSHYKLNVVKIKVRRARLRKITDICRKKVIEARAQIHQRSTYSFYARR